MERARKILNKVCYFMAGMFFATSAYDAWNVDMRFITWCICFILAIVAARLSELEEDSIFGLPADEDTFRGALARVRSTSDER